MATGSKKYQASLAGIDLLRLLLSLAVVVYHYKMFFYPFTTRSKVPMEKLPMNGLLQPLYEHGAYAVEIFWLISGFIFYRIYAEAIAVKKVGFKEFSLLRFSRLYPLHFATLIIVAVLQYMYKAQHWVYFAYPTNDAASFIRHLFFVSKWGDYGLSFNGPVWSVSIEVFVYLLFFAVCALGLLRNKGIFIVVGMAAVCYLFQFPKPFSECIYYFFSGCLLCYWYNKGYKPLQLLLGYCIVAALFAALTIYGKSGGNMYDTLRTTTGITASSIVVLGFIYTFGKMRSQRTLIFLKSCGDITYATYLIHFPVMLVASLLIHPQSDIMFQSPLSLLAFVLLVIIAGIIVYWGYERPVQRWLRQKWQL